MNKRFRKNDFFFLAIVALLLIGLLFFFSFSKGKSGDYVVITVNQTEFGTYPLSKDDVIQIDTGDALNVLTVQDGEAKMTEADCPDKLCVHQKAISHDRETIVCLPHKVVVTVKSSEDSDLDAIAN